MKHIKYMLVINNSKYFVRCAAVKKMNVGCFLNGNLKQKRFTLQYISRL